MSRNVEIQRRLSALRNHSGVDWVERMKSVLLIQTYFRATLSRSISKALLDKINLKEMDSAQRLSVRLHARRSSATSFKNIPRAQTKKTHVVQNGCCYLNPKSISWVHTEIAHIAQKKSGDIHPKSTSWAKTEETQIANKEFCYLHPKSVS